jgi:hypothetical protein
MTLDSIGMHLNGFLLHKTWSALNLGHWVWLVNCQKTSPWGSSGTLEVAAQDQVISSAVAYAVACCALEQHVQQWHREPLFWDDHCSFWL